MQMNAHFFDPKTSISAIEMLATFKLACDTHRIHQGAVTWLLTHYVNETLAYALNGRMCVTEKYSSIAASVRNVDD